ncbi:MULTISPECIES: hypothetical protein, partial [unclassified Rhizobium]|uniref:hypothetical protein n=1 Tax=unclassified Rhizobium TaxID=2613769 RepID=UPI001AED3C5E
PNPDVRPASREATSVASLTGLCVASLKCRYTGKYQIIYLMELKAAVICMEMQMMIHRCEKQLDADKRAFLRSAMN